MNLPVPIGNLLFFMNIYSFNWIKLQEGLRNNSDVFTRIYPGAEFLHALSVGSTDLVMGVVEVVPDLTYSHD